jgi:hypothetical protein
MRNLQVCEGGWCWRTDPRLRLASAMKLSREHLAAVLSSIDVPGLLVLASEGLGSQGGFRDVLPYFDGLEVETIAGEHHCHLLGQAGAIARLLNNFFAFRSR